MKCGKIFKCVAAVMLAGFILLPGMTIHAEENMESEKETLASKVELASGERILKVGDYLTYVTVTNTGDETAIGVNPVIGVTIENKEDGMGWIIGVHGYTEERVDIPAGASHVFEVNFHADEYFVNFWGAEQKNMTPLDGNPGCFGLYADVHAENAKGSHNTSERYYVSLGDGNELPFGDVSTDHWYYDYVKYVYDRGLMTGLNENDFGAVQSLARAQFAVILYRMEGEPEVEYKDVFPDVADGQWYTDAIMWANQAGIVTGYTDSGLFGFADDINREQMAVMMHRYAEYKGFDISKKADFNAFSDAASVNEFADEAMQWAVGTGIISGKDEGTRIDPQGDAARAECATIIQRFVTAYGM